MASTSCEMGQGDTVAGTAQTFYIPQSVLNYLGANNTVGDLYALANAALAGSYVPGPGEPSLGDIAQALGAINDGFDECRIIISFSSTPPAISNSGVTSHNTGRGITMSAYPNPFHTNTTITFQVDVDTNVTLDVYTLSGTKVATLYDGMVVGGKTYNVSFKGQTLHDGMYIYRLNTPDQSRFEKLILIK
jgi:hypothetical protein